MWRHSRQLEQCWHRQLKQRQHQYECHGVQIAHAFDFVQVRMLKFTRKFHYPSLTSSSSLLTRFSVVTIASGLDFRTKTSSWMFAKSKRLLSKSMMSTNLVPFKAATSAGAVGLITAWYYLPRGRAKYLASASSSQPMAAFRISSVAQRLLVMLGLSARPAACTSSCTPSLEICLTSSAP